MPVTAQLRNSRFWILVIVVLAALVGGVVFMFMKKDSPPRVRTTPESLAAASAQDGLERATFGGGCFWCTEAVYQQLKGVQRVASGYSGGRGEDPSYDEICTGMTGHAEVIQISYDPKLVSYADLLEVFWKTHDPTTLNRQGNDFGTQYRSVVFYHNEEQRKLAEHYKQKLDASGAFRGPLVTEIAPFTAFYQAEEYHQNFYQDNPRQPYCMAIVGPKVEKFRAAFQDKLK